MHKLGSFLKKTQRCTISTQVRHMLLVLLRRREDIRPVALAKLRKQDGGSTKCQMTSTTAEYSVFRYGKHA